MHLRGYAAARLVHGASAGQAVEFSGAGLAAGAKGKAGARDRGKTELASMANHAARGAVRARGQQAENAIEIGKNGPAPTSPEYAPATGAH